MMGCCGGGHAHMREAGEVPEQPTSRDSEDPMAILKTRLARGEITIEEYEKTVAVLSR